MNAYMYTTSSSTSSSTTIRILTCHYYSMSIHMHMAAESELLDEPQLAARSPWAYGTLQRDSNHRRRKLVQNSAAREHTNWSR